MNDINIILEQYTFEQLENAFIYLYVAIDGTLGPATDVTGVTVNNSAYKIAIGRYGENGSAYMNGWIDEFRFSKGIARWTTNFTPPTSAYAPAGGTRVMFF